MLLELTLVRTNRSFTGIVETLVYQQYWVNFFTEIKVYLYEKINSIIRYCYIRYFFSEMLS